MKKILFAGAALAALIAIPASAQIGGGQPRGPMAGPLTRASVQANVQARFAMVDANHDGFVTREEADARTEFRRERMRERMQARRGRMEARGERGEGRGQDMRARMSDRFDRLDANHDGSISRAEFDGAMAARAEHRREGAPGMGRGPMMRGEGMRHGGPGDGRMARRGGGMGGMGGFGANMFERLDADHDGRVSLAEAQAKALAMFDRIDANRDGTVTPDERRAARERFREGRQGRREG